MVLVALCACFARARDVSNFDHDWRFHSGEVAGAEKPELVDAKWRMLDVPHDWMIEQPFDRHVAAEVGALDGGVGWYRKTFTLPSSALGQRVFIEFDGVYMNSDVWLNGTHIGNHPYGYTSFEYDLTPKIKFDGPNVLAVRTEVVQPCSRFYSGGGIYRHVRLITTDPTHISHWGTSVNAMLPGESTTQSSTQSTTQNAAPVDYESATIDIATNLDNDGGPLLPISVEEIILDPSGDEVAKVRIDHGPLPADSHGVLVANPHLTIPQPQLWSVETPFLYQVRTNVLRDGKIIDSTQTSFGIRTFEFTKDDGFHLNGKRVEIQGVCDHHDLGCLGSAINTRALQRQLEILRSFGVNAIRTSHNPPAPELLDLCDRMGFLVMDEAFDEWEYPKRKMGYGRFFDDWSERDLTSMIQRDRNHPSVILWSIGNEIPEQRMKDGPALSSRLTQICHKLEPTRPVTSAMNYAHDAVRNGFADPLDVDGINYNVGEYNDPAMKGIKPMLGSENSSTVSSRGEYGLSLKDGRIATTQKSNNQVTSYDRFSPSWATRADTDLQAEHSATWLAGGFMWTGFDYLGEPTPFGWPSRSSYFGIVDLCGFPKDRYYLYQSQWTSTPMVHLLPHWTWPGFEGKPIEVVAYTNADTVELFLNARSLGVRTMDSKKSLHLAWSVPYEAGELKAIARKGGNIVATDVVRTAGAEAKLELSADRTSIDPDGIDLSFVTIRVVDANGTICPNAEDNLTYSLEGPGAIAGLDDGDATNHQRFQGNEHQVFHGMGLAVVRSTLEKGKIHLTATAAGVGSASVDITTK